MDIQQATYFLNTALPKIIKTVLKQRSTDDDQVIIFQTLLRSTLELLIENLTVEPLNTLPVLCDIFDSDQYFFLIRGGPAILSSDDGEIYSSFPMENRFGTWLLVDLVNYFGRRNGFHILLELMRNVDPKMLGFLPAYVMKIFWNIQSGSYFARNAIDSICNRIHDTLTSRFSQLSNEDLKNFKKEDMESLIKLINKFFNSAHGSSAAAEIVETLQLSVALQCFQSQIFDKRIFGLKHINDAIQSTKSTFIPSYNGIQPSYGTLNYGPYNSSSSKESKFLTISFMLEWLDHHQIISQLYGSSAHHELLKRSGDIIGFLARNGKLAKEQLEQIWICATTVHEAFTSTVFKVLGEIASDFHTEHMQQLEGYLRSMGLANVKSNTLLLARDLAKGTTCIDSRLNLMRFLWQVALDESGAVSQELAHQAMLNTVELVEVPQFKLFRYEWMESVILNIKAEKSTVFCWELMGHIIASFTPKSRLDDESVAMAVHKMDREHQLLLVYFEDLYNFKTSVKKDVTERNLPRTEDTDLLTLGHCRLGFSAEVNVRLRFLAYILRHSEKEIPIERLIDFWDLLVADSVTDSEMNAAFDWFTRGLEDMDQFANGKSASLLFQSKFLSLDGSTISLPGFKCFTAYFIHNAFDEYKINPVERMSSKETEWEVLDYDMNGYDWIWSVIMDNKSEAVVRDAVDFLIKLHLRAHERDYCKSRDLFVQRCLLKHLEENSEDFNLDIENKSRRIHRSLRLLQDFCEKCHAEAGAKLPTHGSSVNNGVALSFRVENLISNAAPPEALDLTASSSETVGELKARIKSLLPKYEGKLEDICLSFKGSQIEDETKMLGSLEIANNGMLTIQGKQDAKNQETVNRTRSSHYSRSREAPPPPDYKEKAQQLVEINHIPESAALLALKRSDWDLEGAVLLLTDSDERQKILDEAHSKAILQEEEDAEKRKQKLTKEQMQSHPSLIISESSQNYIEQLFHVWDLGDEELSQRVWTLLLSLPTYKSLSRRIHIIVQVGFSEDEEDEEPDWNSLLPTSSPFKLLYSLQIVESILFPNIKNTEASSSNNKMWVREFVIRGGFKHIFNILATTDWTKTMGYTSSSLASKRPPPQQRSCLALILKICNLILCAVFGAQLREHEKMSAQLAAAVNQLSQLSAGNLPKNNPTMSMASDSLSDLPELVDIRSSAVDSSSKTLSRSSSLNHPQSLSEQDLAEFIGGLPNEIIEKQLFAHVSVPALAKQLLKIVMMESNASENESKENASVVSYAMRLLVPCVLREPRSMMQQLYESTDFAAFIKKTVMEGDLSNRMETVEGLVQIATHIELESGGGLKHPHPFFVEILIGMMPTPTEKRTRVWSNCGQYFAFLEQLAANVPKDSSVYPAEQFYKLFWTLLKGAQSRPIVEARNSNLVDELFVGQLRVLKALGKQYHLLEVFQPPPMAHPLSEDHSSDQKADIPKQTNIWSQLGREYNMVQFLYDCLFSKETEPNPVGPPRCKTRVSRTAAFALLIELSRGSNENLLNLFSLMIPHHSGNFKLNSWDYSPKLDDKPHHGYVGLKNLGNTCYINALLQQLYVLPDLRIGLFDVEENKEETLIYQLQTIFGHLQEAEKATYEPFGFCHAYRDWEGRPMNVHQQQDVEEFFNLLCQRIEARLKGTGQEKLLQSIFAGKICNEIRSVDENYPYVSESQEDFFTLSLDIKGKSNIYEALDAYVKEDRLVGDNAYYCDKYQRKVDVIKRGTIQSLSNTLILHLKRFDFDFTSYRKHKVNDRIVFPFDLDMRPWSREGIAAAEGRQIPLEEQHEDDYYQYELKGVLVHSGIADAGHYYSYIKERGSNHSLRSSIGEADPSGRWFEYNDKTVSPFDPNDIPTECYGGTQQVSHWDDSSRSYVKKTYDRVRSAYMLFYDRVVPYEGSVLKTSPRQSTIVHLPSQIYSRVWKENAVFLRDRQFFDTSYFEFVLKFSELGNQFNPMMEYNSPAPQNMPSFAFIKFLTHFMVEILVRAEEGEVYVRPYVDRLKGLLVKNIPACKWLLEYLTAGQHIKELLLECPNEKTRICIADLINLVLRTLGPYEYQFWSDSVEITKSSPVFTSPQQRTPSRTTSVDALQTTTEVVRKPLCLRFIDQVFHLLEDSRNYWKKFKQYFQVLKEFAEIGPFERHHLMSIGLIAQFADWFTGKEKKNQIARVPVMDQFNLPDLTSFIACLSILYRGCQTSAPMDKGNPPTSILQPNPLTGQIVILDLPRGEKRALFNHRFFESMLEMDYNTAAAVEIILHACWEDLKRTKFIMEIILSSLHHTSSSEKFPIFQNLLLVLLQMKDSLQSTRSILAISPFAATGLKQGRTLKGLLAMIHDIHSNNGHHAANLVKLLMILSHHVPTVENYLVQQIREVYWLDQFLDSRSNHDDSARIASTFVKNFLKNVGNQVGTPSYDRERELVEELDLFRKENTELKRALERYRQLTFPNLNPPDFMMTKKWEMDASYRFVTTKPTLHFNHEDSDSDNDSIEETPAVESNRSNGNQRSSSGPTPEEINQKAEQLTEFLGVSMAVGIAALKKTNYDVEGAAVLLSDDTSMMDLMREVEAEEAQQQKEERGIDVEAYNRRKKEIS